MFGLVRFVLTETITFIFVVYNLPRRRLFLLKQLFPFHYYIIYIIFFTSILILIQYICCFSGQFRDIQQFHYITWPDFGVPSSPTAFLEFLRKVRDAGVLESTVGPAIIHCSAGIGRSGTFCLVDSCLILVSKIFRICLRLHVCICENIRFLRHYSRSVHFRLKSLV